MRKSGPSRFYKFYLLCLIIIFMNAMTSCNRSDRYVSADVLKLRTEPGEGAQEVGRLRINTEVRVLEKQDGWVKIVANGIQGWTPRSLLVNKPLTLAYALQQAKSATGAEQAAWLERAVALDPANNEAWISLAEAYSALGKTKQALYSRQIAAGDQPIYVSACSGEKVKLYSVYEPSSGFRKLTGEFISQQSVDADENTVSSPQQKPILPEEGIAMQRDLDRIAGELQDLMWSRLSKTQVSDIFFLHPKIHEDVEESCPGESPTISMWTELGTCPKEQEWVAVSAPLEDLNSVSATGDARREALIRRALKKKGVNNIERIEIRSVPGGPALYEVLFTGTIMMETYGRNQAATRATGWALVGNSPETLAFGTLSDDGKPEHAQGEPIEIGKIAWAKWARITVGPKRWIAVVPWSYESFFEPYGGKGSGYWLILVDEQGRVFMTRLDVVDNSGMCG